MSLIVIDFETFYSKDYSLSKMTTEAYVRSAPFQVIGFAYRIDDQDPVWVTGSDKEIASALHALDLPSHKVCGHNLVFDAAILAFRYAIQPKFMYDTLSMARPIQAITKGGSLAALAKKFCLGEKGTEVINALGKRREDFSPAEMAKYGEYCINDVILTYNLFQVLKQYSTPQECYVIDLLLRMYTDPVIQLDHTLLVGHLASVQAKKDALMAKLDASIGRDALMSNPKFAQLLTQLGVTPPTKISGATGKETFAFSKTDVAFKELLEHDDVRVQALVSARLGIKSTLEETRTQSFIEMSSRGGLPIMLNYYGAHTGRASGGDGVNLQNLPRGGALRKSMRAPAGHKLVACDSAQIEARVVAWWAGQDDLVGDFAAGADVYSKFAGTVYGYEVNKKEHPTERFVGKTCLAEGSLVLCDSGWKPIESVTTNDLLWDGEEWVCHQGLMNKGEKDVLSLSGLWLTPDHCVWSGTQWKEAECLLADESTLSQALEYAAESWSLLDMYQGVRGGFAHCSSNATAGARNIRWSTKTSRTLKAHVATPAQRSLLRGSGIGNIPRRYPMTRTEHGYSTDLLQQSHDAIARQANTTNTMVNVESMSTPNGGKIVQNFCATFNRWKGGISQSLKWIGSTLTAPMPPGISVLPPGVTTCITNEKSKILNSAFGILRRKSTVYDLVNAGPRHRFTALTARGPIVVSNCILGLGFGCGAVKFKSMLKVGATPVDIELPESERIVAVYRARYPMIAKLWKDADAAIKAMARSDTYHLGVGLPLVCNGDGIKLPNGMMLRYPNLRYLRADGEKIRQDGWYYDTRYGPVGIYGAKLVENVVQALARIVVFTQMARIDMKLRKNDRKYGFRFRFKTALTVHDEVVVCCPAQAAEKVKDMMVAEMSMAPSWAPALPVACEADIGDNYAESK